MNIHIDPAPLRVECNGEIRVSDVLLEDLLSAHKEGAPPRYVVKAMYPTLTLADIYGAIAYCLKHRDEIASYLKSRRDEYENRCSAIEAKDPSNQELRARLANNKTSLMRSGIWEWPRGENGRVNLSQTRSSPEIRLDPAPLRIEENGSVRVGKTRVLFDLVIEAYEDGATPEYIANEMYTTLEVDEAYAAIAYYLRHRDEILPYLRAREEEGERLRQTIESQPGHQELKNRILQRKAEMDKAHAAAAQ